MTEARQLGFTDAGEVYRGPNSVAISNTPLPPPQAHHKASKAKGKLGMKREKRGGELGGNGR